MGLSRYEQETVINYNNDEATMRVYTADPALMRRLKSLPAYECIQEDRQDGKVIAMTFKASKKLVFLRSKELKVNLSEEEKAKRAERLRLKADLRKKSPYTVGDSTT